MIQNLNEVSIKVLAHRKASALWAERHPEEKRIINRRYYIRHTKEVKERAKERQKKNPDKAKEAVKRWREKNPDYLRARESRKRDFGFIPLNNYFENTVAHHIDKNYVIYIPKEIHDSIYHSVLKNINMEKVNNLAYKYFSE